MAIHPIEFRYGSEEMKGIFREENRLQKLLDVEAALARAHSTLGHISQEAAREISTRANTEEVKVERVKEIEGEIKHDLMAVVQALAERCGEAGEHVHLGATSYDIIDTANALQFREALEIIEKRLFDLEGSLLHLAEKHVTTVAVGRTHGQHAIPITYGLKFALFAREVRRHLNRLGEVEERAAVGKMSGAVGTMASFGAEGFEIQNLVMEELGLKPATVSSQVVQRDRYGELLNLLALIAASMDKFAKEVRNLMRTEIAEVSEPFGEKKQVGSSTMPHKRNPINAENMCGLARVVKSNAYVGLENVALEHERDLTNSSAERVVIPESFILLDEILMRANRIFSGLVLREENIKRNLGLTLGQNMAEAAMMALTKKGMGRQEAHELMREKAVEAYNEGEEYREVLKRSGRVLERLSEDEIEEALNPRNYIGTAIEQVEMVLEKARRERATS